MTFTEFKERLKDHKGDVCLHGRNTYARISAVEALKVVPFGIKNARNLGRQFLVLFPPADSGAPLWLDCVNDGEEVTE